MCIIIIAVILGEELDIRLVTSGRDLLNFDVEENEKEKSLNAVLFGDPDAILFLNS